MVFEKVVDIEGNPKISQVKKLKKIKELKNSMGRLRLGGFPEIFFKKKAFKTAARGCGSPTGYARGEAKPSPDLFFGEKVSKCLFTFSEKACIVTAGFNTTQRNTSNKGGLLLPPIFFVCRVPQ